MQKFILDLHPISLGKMKIKTRRLPPSLNARMHWAERAKWNKEFKDQVYWLCKIQKIPASKYAEITVINYTLKPMDRDNLYGASKACVDAVVLAGVIPDDSEIYLDLKVKNVLVKTRKEQRVEMVIAVDK